MERETKVFEELFGQKLGHTRYPHIGASDLLVPFPGGLVRAIEDEERVDVEREEAQEAIVEGSQSRVCATLAGLDLEQPDADVDGEAEGAGVLDVVFGGEFADGDALTGADLFINAACCVSRGILAVRSHLPMNTHICCSSNCERNFDQDQSPIHNHRTCRIIMFAVDCFLFLSQTCLTKAASASSVAMAAAARPALSHDLFDCSFLLTCLVACLDGW
jgi:hypothetical protein